jgi:hypothetical protein
MEVPRYRRSRQQPNNVAPIWLLRGTAKRVSLHDVALATLGVLFHARRLFRSNLSDSSRVRLKGSGFGTTLAET